MKKAIAYVSDVILGRTGEVIKRSCQVELINQYAADNDTEIVGWFEDEIYNEDLMSRPGVKALLACGKSYDVVLCERVWALSRSMAALEPFLRELDRRGVKLESATTMWDCVSQKVRHRHAGARPIESPRAAVNRRTAARARHRVARPTHLHFGSMVR